MSRTSPWDPCARAARTVLVLCAAGVVGGMLPQAPARAQATSVCGELWNAYGPYDYRTDRHKLPIVERFHFTPQVEALIKGESTKNIAGDLNYTLRAFPNHHRALLSMSRLSVREKNPQPMGALYPVDCYFDRALRFRPDDHVARIIFADHLGRSGRADAAVLQLQSAAAAVRENPLSHYNIGLVYFDLKRYDEALAQAHKALALGFTRTELRDKLKAAGRWVEP
jgi:tetratricopeptide (TPR) repeat protein